METVLKTVWQTFLHFDSCCIELQSLSRLALSSFDSTGHLVRSWLFCIQHVPCLVRFWCMLGVGVGVWTKNILYRLVEGQTYIGMQSRGAKISLALNDPKQVALHSNLNTTSEHTPSQQERNNCCCMDNNPWKIIGNKLSTKSPIGLKDNSNV